MASVALLSYRENKIKFKLRTMVKKKVHTGTEAEET
jgi:hypothetical protein